MTPSRDLETASTETASDPGAARMPRLKLSSRGFQIDHPDPRLGEQLMADALGVADRDAMHGILKQLVKASAAGRRPDAGALAFMLSVIRSIAPRDPVEAMLAAQMVSVHVATMRCAYQLASADDIVGQDSAARALARLARTFPAQIDALTRYRSSGKAAITVQNLSVQEGGNAIVGHVTQQAGLFVSPARSNTGDEDVAALTPKAGAQPPGSSPRTAVPAS